MRFSDLAANSMFHLAQVAERGVALLFRVACPGKGLDPIVGKRPIWVYGKTKHRERLSNEPKTLGHFSNPRKRPKTIPSNWAISLTHERPKQPPHNASPFLFTHHRPPRRLASSPPRKTNLNLPHTLIPNYLLIIIPRVLGARGRGGGGGEEEAMAPVAREWTGINQFPAATQAALLELLGKLKHERVSSLTILVLGKGGVGKSSTVNSMIGERAVTVSSFQSEGVRPVMVSRTRADFTLNIVDTPGLVEGGYVNRQVLDMIKRVDSLDMQIIEAITESFGKGIWDRAAVVLTHAQLSPPDGLSYEEFLGRRSKTLLEVVHKGAGKVQPFRAAVNNLIGSDWLGLSTILPNGIAWIPELVKNVTEMVSNGTEAIHVDKKLVDGPNPNAKNKVFIPPILLVQNT
ncbi:Translocase of chloroplast 34-like protein [Drosera capensis]